jgi:hypothetical protein
MIFKEYRLTADLLCIGERLKGGRYKPSAETLRYSQLVGALKRTLGVTDVHAVGHLIKPTKQYLSYNLTDRYAGGAKLPLKVELLTDVEGKVYIFQGVSQIPDEFELDLGGMLSKGIGRCRLKYTKTYDSERTKKLVGPLNTRIPIRSESPKEMEELKNQGGTTSFLSKIFGVQAVKTPVFGYLFKPENEYTGHYELALFEKSKIQGPDFLIGEQKNG